MSGRGKKTLLAVSTFRIEHTLKIQMSQFGVGHVWIFLNNSGKHTITKESFYLKPEVVHTFQLPFFIFFIKKIYRFLAD